MTDLFTKVGGWLRSIPQRFGRHPESRTYIPELDGLRFLAIAFVLVWHASLRAARHIDRLDQGGAAIGNYYRFFPHGEIGVVLFFFISGFVVSLPFLGKPRADWKIAEFYRRRFIRIYPPYLVAMILCYFVLAIVGHAPTDAYAFRDSAIPLTHSFLASLVYLHGIVFNGPSRLNPPIWSLEIEVMFYALLPLILWIYCGIPSRRWRIASMWGVIGGVVLASSLLIATSQTDLRFRWGLFYHSYLFLLGIVVADMFGNPAKRDIVKHPAYDALFLCGFGLLIIIGLRMTETDARMPGGSYALGMEFLTICATVGIFYGAFHGRLASFLLSLSWLRLIGTMCYSIYLTHIAIMTAFGEALEHIFDARDANVIYIVYLAVLSGAAVMGGSIFYVCIERPCAQRVGRGSVRPTGETASTRSFSTVDVSQ